MSKIKKYGWLIGILTSLEYGSFVGFFAWVILRPDVNNSDYPLVSTLSTAMLVHALICALLGAGTAATIQGELETRFSATVPYGLLTSLLALPAAFVIPALTMAIGAGLLKAGVELDYLIYLLGAIAIAGYFLALVASSMLSAGIARKTHAVEDEGGA